MLTLCLVRCGAYHTAHVAVVCLYDRVALLGLFLVYMVFGVAMGVAVITDSILRLQLSFNMMRYKLGKYIAVMIFSLLMLIAGIIMVFNPIESAATATVVMGCCMLVDGIMNLISIIFAKKMLTEV